MNLGDILHPRYRVLKQVFSEETTVVPNLNQARIFRYNTTENITIANPNNLRDGSRIRLEISSVDGKTVSFGNQYKINGISITDDHLSDTLIIYNGYYNADTQSLNIASSYSEPEPSNFSDWFLPSQDEMAEVYNELYLYGVGGLNIRYWTSTESSNTWGRMWYFDLGYSAVEQKVTPNWVRPIRAFTAAIDQYALRDVGPGGGLIFYIDGTTYYEAAESDISDGYYWSNITDVAIGTTGTAIGTGLANTAAIIDQDGHTTSAALLCSNYPEIGIGTMAIGSTFIIY